MLTHPRRARVFLATLADGGLFMLALAASYGLRAYFPLWDLPNLEDITHYLPLFPWIGIVGPLMLRTQNFYEQPRITSRLGVVLIVVRGCLFTVLGTILFLFLIRVQFARSVIIMMGAIGGIAVYARHEITRWSTAGENLKRRTLWVGSSSANQTAKAALSGIERESIFDLGESAPDSTTPSELEERLHEESIEAVVFSLEGVHESSVKPLVEVCEREGVEVLIRPNLPVGAVHRLALDELGGEPIVYVRAQSASPIALAVKQGIDFLGAALLLVVFSPILALLGLIVRFTSSGPVIFRQKRAGKNGREFTMLKFRSMRADAEENQAELRARNELNGPAFKVRNDPRTTPVGRILRRHSLDELPQLVNVLKGEMSLVGPRPLPVEEATAIAAGADRRRLSVKPGMTGLWQISGRSDLADFTDWVRLDLAYIDQWTLWLDGKILLATIPVTLLGRNR